MNDLSGRGEMGLKEERPADDPDRLASVALTPCVCCYLDGTKQLSRTEVHHVKSGRYSQRKEVDRKTIGLCHGHHHRLFAIKGEENHIGFHNSQETWEARYGPDHKLIKITDEFISRLDDECIDAWI